MCENKQHRIILNMQFLDQQSKPKNIISGEEEENKYENRRSWKTTFFSSSVAFSTFFAIKATCWRLLILHASLSYF